MNRQIIFASALAAAAAGLAYFYLSAQEAAIKASAAPWFVMVAKRALGPGTGLASEHVLVREIPAAYVMPGAVASASSRGLHDQWEKYCGQTALAPVAKGEQILSNKFSARPPGFAALVPEGLRSAAFALEPAAANAGRLRPGNFVDVLAALGCPGPNARSRMMVMLAQNVQVLAVGAGNGPDKGRSRSEDWGPAGTVEVCLALAPADLLRISWAEKEGSLKLALRGIGDEQECFCQPQTLETVISPALGNEKKTGGRP